ncbi:helix-turn-helix transcriptional regulator [Sphingomonas koreensis]
MDADWSTGDAVAPPALRCVADSGCRQAVPLRDAGMAVTRVDLGTGEPFELPASAARVGIAILIGGGASFEIEGAAMHVAAGQVILNAHHGAVRGVWPAGGGVILAALPRNAIQARASASHGGARRLARAAFVFGADDGLAALDAGHAREDAAIHAVVAALAAHYGIDDACPASRSISLARLRLDADPARAWDLEDLARGVGITRITLQRGFRDCIGATVAGYAQALRLAEARARLASGRETRPVNAIAHAAGFASATAFARAYQRIFGETPTQTRADFARSFHGDHIESG